MNTILATAYAVNPYKGSEDGMGWNFILQIARNHQVIAITRKNNRPAIESYQREFPNELYPNIQFHYYDLPYWMRFWKRKEKGAMLYFFLWQLFMPIFIWGKALKFDIAHNLNFHTDWIPTFLWILGKPTVWGPVGHHPKLQRALIQPFYGKKAYLKVSLKWWIKKLNWDFNPFLWLSAFACDKVILMSGKSENVLQVPDYKSFIMPSVGTEQPNIQQQEKNTAFQALIVGRMVPLKGFDIALESFARFYHNLPHDEQQLATLQLVGKGPYKEKLVHLSHQLQIDQAVQFIDWMERSELSKCYQRSSIFFFPSYEGAGMVVAEALSYGLPVVCFDNCGPGAFINAECGVKIPLETNRKQIIRNFADALRVLFESHELRDQLASGAANKFKQHFLWDRKGETLHTLYQELLHHPKTTTKSLTVN